MYTDELNALLGDAAGEAQALNREYIGTEHVLLALLAEPENTGASALRNLGVDLRGVANRLLALIHGERRYRRASSVALLPFSSRSKIILDQAVTEAQSLNHPYVGTGHVLLALLAEGKGVAAQVLIDAGVTDANARAEVLRLIGTMPSQVERVPDDRQASERPSNVGVVLEYENGTTITKRFTNVRAAIAFLDSR